MNAKPGWRALLVGVSQYDDESFPDVPAALNSLEAMKRILTDPNLCGWPEDCITVIENPRRAIDVGKPLRELAVDTEGTLLVYFVGHGTVNSLGELCLAVGESILSDIEFSGLEYDNLKPILNSSPAGKKIVILDCCYSGKAIEALTGESVGIADATATSGAYTLTAADRAAHVPSPQHSGSRTSFTNALVEVVEKGVPGSGEFLTLTTIYGRLHKKLSSKGLPNPNQRGTNNVGSFAFSRNAAYKPPRPESRTIDQQLPTEPSELAMLAAIQKRFNGRQEDFLPYALSIWRLIAPTTGECNIVRSRYGNRNSIHGKYLIGPIDDRIELNFALDASCQKYNQGVDSKSMSRLIYSIRDRHFGVFITLSYVDEEVYKHIRADQLPIVVVCGKDIVDAMKAHGYSSVAAIEEWITTQGASAN